MKQTDYSADFDAWWSEYPRRVGKGKAWDVWRQLEPVVCDRALHAMREQLVSGAQLDIKTRKKWDGTSTVPYPATWLSERRFDDDPDIQSGAGSVPNRDPVDWANETDDGDELVALAAKLRARGRDVPAGPADGDPQKANPTQGTKH